MMILEMGNQKTNKDLENDFNCLKISLGTNSEYFSTNY